MIAHMATFIWKPEVTEADVAALTSDLREMADGLPHLRAYHCGENLRLRPGADYGVIAVVDDEAGLDAYLDSPAHVAVYERWLGWMIETRQAAQLPLGDDGLV